MILSGIRKTTVVAAALLLRVGLFSCQGHEGPAEVIARLSGDIDAGRGSAETFLARAIEYRIINKPSRAARDLRLAAQRNPDLVAVWRESAQVFLDLGDSSSAIQAARTALSTCNSDSRQASSCRLLLAETLYRCALYAEAEETIESAFSQSPDMDVNAYWLRAKILDQLDRPQRRAECLREGWELTRSEALRIAWIESCIDLGQGAEVLEVIEQGLRSARLKSAWRLRRAKVMISLERIPEAERELVATIAELDQRINLDKPCREFMADRKLASDLLFELAGKS